MNDQVFYGTPRTLPRVLLCSVPTHWCGRHWTANTAEQYDEMTKERVTHEQLCSGSRGLM